MIERLLLPEGIEATGEDLAKTPPSVLKLLMYLFEDNRRLKKRIEELERKIK